MSSAAPPVTKTPTLPRVLGPIRPRPRWLELRLLGLVAIALLVGSVSLSATIDRTFRLYDAAGLLIYLAALLAAHLAQVLAGRRTDQVLLPTVAMLGGVSLLLMQRLPQDLVTQTFFGTTLGLAQVQLVWLLCALAVATTLGIVVRSDAWLRRYKYTWAAAGVGLLLLTFVFGTEINGQRLTLQIGPFSGQPTELLKVILVVFLAGYLSENRALLVEQDTTLGPFRMPPLAYLAPMVAMWAIALGIVVIQRDLGAALLFFGVFLAMLYVATGRLSLVVIGLILFILGSALMAMLFDHIRTRVDIWLDPFADPLGAGYQVIQALHAFARGGLLGVALSRGAGGLRSLAERNGGPARGACAGRWAACARADLPSRLVLDRVRGVWRRALDREHDGDRNEHRDARGPLVARQPLEALVEPADGPLAEQQVSEDGQPDDDGRKCRVPQDQRPLIGAADACGGDRGRGQSGQHEPFWATDPEHQAGGQCCERANVGEPFEYLLGSPASTGSMHRARGTMANDRCKPKKRNASPQPSSPWKVG